MKKGQGLTMNTVVIAALSVIVITVIVIIFYSFISEGSRGGKDIISSAERYCASFTEYPNHRCYLACPEGWDDDTTSRVGNFCGKSNDPTECYKKFNICTPDDTSTPKVVCENNKYANFFNDCGAKDFCCQRTSLTR
ncbi:hypothetical protein ACFL1H_00185 [Nanoarchaeota archaeon]